MTAEFVIGRELGCVGAVGGDAKEGDLAGVGTPRSVSDDTGNVKTVLACFEVES